MAMIQNYDPEWTVAEAVAAHKQDAAEGNDFRLGPLTRWNAHHHMIDLGRDFERGDKMALFAAIRTCANHDMPLPEWAAKAFIRSYDKVLNCHANSWDAVFGLPYPKGSHLNSLRKRRLLRVAVSVEARRILDSGPDTPIDEAFFEKIGKTFNIGKTLASELYYSAKKQGLSGLR